MANIIDAQLHIWESAPKRPWDIGAGFTSRIASFSIEDAVAAMDIAGVDSAVLSLPPAYRSALPNGAFRYDNSYAEEAATRFPNRFSSVILVDPDDPDAIEIVRTCRNRPGTLGLRLVLGYPRIWDQFCGGKFAPILDAAQSVNLPVMIAISGRTTHVRELAITYPKLNIIVDHLGLKQPPAVPRGSASFAQLDETLALARFGNVSMKLTGIPSLSDVPYPFDDLWLRLHQVIAAFGPERLMWGSDITRLGDLHTYSEAVDYIRNTDEISAAHRSMILGGNLRRLLRWPQ